MNPHDKRIRGHPAVESVERSLLLEATRAVVVEADDPIRLICELRDEYEIVTKHVVCSEVRAAIHYIPRYELRG